MPTRVHVFIDYSNVYYAAREVFGNPDRDPLTFGHVLPQRLGLLVKQLGDDTYPDRELHAVTAYLGEPGTKSGPTRQSAFGRQVALWRTQPKLTVRTRPLRYIPTEWSMGRAIRWRAQEKGVDVMMALDIAIGARDALYDVGIIVSADSDLLPAIEVALGAGRHIETAMWWSPDDPHRRLRVPNRQLWNHRLDAQRFEYLRDDTDYATKPRRTR